MGSDCVVPYHCLSFLLLEQTLAMIYTQQTQNVSETFLECCILVASDLTLQKRFYNILSDLCLEMSNIQKHVW